MDRTFVALDLETTGLSPRLDRIIEVGAVRFRGADILDTFRSFARPEVAIPLSVQRLTGISEADVASAPRPEEVVMQLVHFVGDSPVVAHSGGFDLSFLAEGPRADGQYELFDTLDLARILLPMAPSHSLPQLSCQLGLTHSQPHRALADADAARQLFTYLWDFARKLPADLLGRMLDITLGWPHPIRSFLEAIHAAGSNGTHVFTPVRPRPTQRREQARPSTDPEQIRDLLDPSGPMAARLDDYELRESQQQMTLAIAQLFQRGGRLLVEAGPGTGKSLAYLLPAVHHAVAAGEKVVVATNTITLQEQLFHKEIPFLKSWLPFDFTPVLMKGRANYVSLRRWNRYLNAPSRKNDGSWFAEETKFKLRMLVWLAQSAHGDRSEIRLSGLDELFWARAASTPDDCLAAHCENYKAQRCFYWNSRRAAQDADLVVTNHALLLADALAGGTVLPPYQHVVVDEAHQLEEAAVESLMARLGEEELSDTLSNALVWLRAVTGASDAAVSDRAGRARQAAGELFRQIASEVKQPPPPAPSGQPSAALPWENRMLLDEAARASPGILAITAQTRELTELLSAVCGAVESAVTSGTLELGSHAPRELEHWAARLSAQADLFHETLVAPRPDRLYWLAIERRSGRPVVQVAPTDAGRTLQEKVFVSKDTVIFTSASLSIADSFAYFRRGVGLPDADAHELVLASPFDYLAQALLCLPTDLKELNDPDFPEQTATTVAAIARALGGRTLVLFTAHQQLRDVAGLLRTMTAQHGLTLLAQNLDGTRRQLLQQFQENPRTVLLGTASFWEGVDVPGDALSCVVIVRLPFRVPTDPVQLARSAGLRDPFAELMLPEAVLRLKQGFGRLIRRRTDRGAVVLLDHRVANRVYGRAFLEALPKAAVFLGQSEEVAPAIGEWLQRVRVPT